LWIADASSGLVCGVCSARKNVSTVVVASGAKKVDINKQAGLCFCLALFAYVQLVQAGQPQHQGRSVQALPLEG
jgi:hypothetical protein